MMAAKKKDQKDLLLEQAARLSPQDRAELAEIGIVLPAGVSAKADLTLSKYGYRCPYCGNVALEFVGTSFTDANGDESDMPDLTLPLSALPWTQTRRDRRHIDRQNPTCQVCAAGIEMRHGYLRSQFLCLTDLVKKKLSEVRAKIFRSPVERVLNRPNIFMEPDADSPLSEGAQKAANQAALENQMALDRDPLAGVDPSKAHEGLEGQEVDPEDAATMLSGGDVAP